MGNNTVRAQKFKWQVFEPGEEEKVGRCTQQQDSEAGKPISNASFPALRRAHDHRSTYTQTVLFVGDETSNEVAVEVPEVDSFKAMPSQQSNNAAQAD